MAYILVRHKVRDFKKFRKVFFDNFRKVKNNGSQGGFIFRNKVNKNEVFILVKWNSLRNFQKFAKSPKIPKDPQKRATVIGKIDEWFFEDAEKFDG